MTIGNLDFIKELVNAFNIVNYPSKTNTNFVVEGNYIIVKFNCSKGSAEKCLLQIKRELARRYFPNEFAASHFFDFASFPFNFDKGKWMHSKAGTQFTVSIDPGVVFNFKLYFAKVCGIIIKEQMIRELQECDCSEEDAEKLLMGNMESEVIDRPSPYLSCTFFKNANVQRHFVQTLQTQMKNCGYDYLDLYHIDDNKVYFKDVENISFVKSITEYTNKKIGYHFHLPSNDNLKVKSYKDAMNELIFQLTRISICGYFHDNFINTSRINDEDNFAFIPIIKDGDNFRYLDYMEADKINAKFSCNLLNDVKGQTEYAQSSKVNCVYAFSDRQIALLIPVIIENSVINKDGQLEINPELPQRLQSPEPSPSRELSQMQASPKRNQEEQMRESPRRGARTETEVFSLLFHNVNSSDRSQQSSSTAAVGASKSVQGDSGESRKLSLSEKAKECASRVMERLKFRRDDKRRASIRSTPEESVSEKLLASPTRSLPGTVRESSPSSEVGSAIPLEDILWKLSGVVEESAPPVEDKSRLGVPVRRNDSKSSQKSNDSGFESGLSPRASLDAVTLTKLEQCRENEVVEL